MSASPERCEAIMPEPALNEYLGFACLDNDAPKSIHDGNGTIDITMIL
jgi:hypothetical protein